MAVTSPGVPAGCRRALESPGIPGPGKTFRKLGHPERRVVILNKGMALERGLGPPPKPKGVILHPPRPHRVGEGGHSSPQKKTGVPTQVLASECRTPPAAAETGGAGPPSAATEHLPRRRRGLPASPGSNPAAPAVAGHGRARGAAPAAAAGPTSSESVRPGGLAPGDPAGASSSESTLRKKHDECD